MYINEVKIRNFRILSDSTLQFKNDICLMIGRNNTGKTSFLVLFEKFLNGINFTYDDFSVKVRKDILTIDETSDENKLSIQLILNIVYEENDDLCNLSEFIMDLDPERKDVNILFECAINKGKLLEDLKSLGKVSKEKYIKKYITNYLDKNIYIFDTLEDLDTTNRYRLIKKDLKDIKKLIDFEIIHAKRSVSSSEEKTSIKVLSALATDYFNNKTVNAPDKFEEINALIEKMDKSLETNYKTFFEDFLKNAKDFLSLDGLKIVSNLKAQEIVKDSSEVVYGNDTLQLPEYLNGLGHMNILYLLLNIEIKKNNFIKNNKDIKLLFIEEPEAHTHPQLQYIFARKISELLKNIKGMQTIITTHSPHIVATHPFENIRYMLNIKDEEKYNNIEIKNFHEDLSKIYSNLDEFKFIQQYLSIESAELFFADKAIFIEGISESMLMQYFIAKFDAKNKKQEEYVSLASQNVTIVQAGANAKAFRHFLEFLKIPTIIITDIDTTKEKQTKKGIRYEACSVEDADACNTSNETIKYYLDAPDIKDPNFKQWYDDMINHKQSCNSEYVNLVYQVEENIYHARSFEDAFINVNLSKIKDNKDYIFGLKNKEDLEEEHAIYELTQNIIAKKSDFSSSLLYIAHTKGIEWETPSYIEEGLKWLQKQ